jgi:uncharacterized protein
MECPGWRKSPNWKSLCLPELRSGTMTIVFAIIGLLLMLFGLAGLIVPFIPGGVPAAWLGLFIFAIGTGFERISILTTVILFLIMLLTIAFDFFAPMLIGGKVKASKWGCLGSLFGSFLGIFVFGIWGIILGPFVGTVFGELLSGRKYSQSLRIGFGTVLGIIIGGILKIIVVIAMIVVLIASWF